MRKIIFFLALFYSLSFAQGWNNTVTTSISTSDLSGIDLFTNRNGNNIVTSNFSFPPISRWIKYYLLNSSGSVIRSSTIEGPSQYLSSFVNVSGDNDNLYAVYLINGIIRAKKSVNAGISWVTYDLTPQGTDIFYGIDIAFDNIENKLHMVYNRGGQTYYYSLNANDQWGEFQQVSSISTNSWPTVSFSQDRVHVSYEEGSVAKSREKYLTSWQTPEIVTSSSVEERIHAGNSKLLYFYSEPQQGFYLDTYVRQRDFNGNWSSPFLLHEVDAFVPAAANTFDSKTHIVYCDDDILYRNYNGSTWSSESTIGTGVLGIPKISSVSNDLYTTWENSNGYVNYRQYDAFPLAPQNLAVQIYTLGSETYPKLTWAFNNEPDVFIKTNAYQVWRRYSLSGGAWSAWTIIGYSDGNESEYIDYSISGLYAESNTAEYKLRVRDYTNQFSDFSSAVSINFSQFNIYKLNNDIVQFGYELDQNYPNPFNPNTKISFSIKGEGLVTLKVYDILGKEVATLVNENKPEGIYETDFDASTLPSGMYIYKLQAGSFTDVKKMLLTK